MHSTPQRNRCVFLDGGLATQLEARGHNLDDTLWSARLLRDEPREIAAVHMDYLQAGADIITTASYQATMEAFIESGIEPDKAQDLLRLSVKLAQSTRDEFWADKTNPTGRIRPRVAASVGPYGAYLANGSEYNGDYDLDESALLSFHRQRWRLLADAEPDLLLCETIPSFAEAQALVKLAAETAAVPVWISFSCRDAGHICDGTSITKCARLVAAHPRIDVIGVNCTPPKFIAELIRRIRETTDTPIAVYPNSGETYDAESGTWSGDEDISRFARQAVKWHELGADTIGGCCRTTPAHIRAAREMLDVPRIEL